VKQARNKTKIHANREHNLCRLELLPIQTEVRSVPKLLAEINLKQETLDPGVRRQRLLGRSSSSILLPHKVGRDVLQRTPLVSSEVKMPDKLLHKLHLRSLKVLPCVRLALEMWTRVIRISARHVHRLNQFERDTLRRISLTCARVLHKRELWTTTLTLAASTVDATKGGYRRVELRAHHARLSDPRCGRGGLLIPVGALCTRNGVTNKQARD